MKGRVFPPHNFKLMTYYKFLSLEKAERFIDILVNNRLYASSYKNFNDPFEGHFDSNGVNLGTVIQIKGRMDKSARICSLQNVENDILPNNRLMWSHYANSHKGVCLKVNVIFERGWKRLQVRYDNELPKLDNSGIDDNIERILSRKSKDWEYEKEVRFLRFYSENNNEAYLRVKIVAVYFGLKMTKKDKELYRKLLMKVNSNIEIYEMIENNNNDYYSNLIPHRY